MARGHRRCEICGIQEGRSGTKLLFSNFPLKLDRCRAWLQAVGNEELVQLPIEKLHENRNVCANHFRKKDFNKKGSRLKKVAVPTLNLEAPPLTESQLVDFPQRLYRSTHPKDNSQELCSEEHDDQGMETTMPGISPMCLCCFQRHVPFISLSTCSHADFLNDFTVPEINVEEQVACYQCHDMLKNIKRFKLQVENNFNLLREQSCNLELDASYPRLTQHKVFDITIPDESIDNEDTIPEQDDLGKETFEFGTDTEKKDLKGKSVSLKSLDATQLKNIQDALNIINSNQCINDIGFIVNSIQVLSTSGNIKDVLKTINLIKSSGNSDNSMLNTEKAGEKSNNIVGDIAPEMVKNEDLRLKENFMQIDEEIRDGPVLPSNNIKCVNLTKEELLEERSKIAISRLYLKSPHRCEHCLISFQYEENFIDHVKRKHVQKPETISCEVCLQYVNPGSAYKEHIKLHYTRYECNSCALRLSTYNRAIFHYKRKHAKTVLYKCLHCRFKTKYRSSLKKHLRKHICKACGVLYSYKTHKT